jgi:hypothetical protein
MMSSAEHRQTGPFSDRRSRPWTDAAPYPVAALACIAAITGIRLAWLAVQPADFYPDEAQYWFWAKDLAWGYYSKPPLIAWLIALTTRLFGDSEFAVRLMAPLLHALTAIVVYAIGARLYGARTGFLVGNRVCDVAWGIGVGLYHIDRCGIADVLGGRTLRLHSGARRGRVALVDCVVHCRWPRIAREIRDGVLDFVVARFRVGFAFRAPASAGAARDDWHRASDLFAEFLVELGQRFCQLPAHPR